MDEDLFHWLEEVDRLRMEEDYFSLILGTPKYDNGIERLYYQGMTPQEALIFWRDYQ